MIHHARRRWSTSIRRGKNITFRGIANTSSPIEQDIPKRSYRWLGVAAFLGVGTVGATYQIVTNDEYLRSANALHTLGKVLSGMHEAKEQIDEVNTNAATTKFEEHASSILVAISKEKMFREALVNNGGLDVLLNTCVRTTELKLKERIVQAIADLANTPGVNDALLNIERTSTLLVQLTPAIVHRQPHDPKPVVVSKLDMIKLNAALTRVREDSIKEAISPTFPQNSSVGVFDRLGKVITGCASPELKTFSMWALLELIDNLQANEPDIVSISLSHLNFHVANTLFAMASGKATISNATTKLYAAKLLTAMLHGTLHPIAAKHWCHEVAKWSRDTNPEIQALSAKCLHHLATVAPQDVLQSVEAQDALLYMARVSHELVPTTSLHVNLSSAVQALAHVLQSRLETTMEAPMSKIFSHLDLPIHDANELGVLPQYGWVDVLTEWSVSSHPRVCQNAIQSLVQMSLREGPVSGQHTITTKSRRAVAQVEALANMTYDQTPGNAQVEYDPLVLEAGIGALAILAEDPRGAEAFITHGGLELIALCAIKSDKAIKSQCARVIANLAFSRKTVRRQMEEVFGGALFLQELLDWETESNSMVRSSYYRAVANLNALSSSQPNAEHGPMYKDGIHPIVSRTSSSSNTLPPVDIVFVHGLRGHPFGTWRTDMESGDMARREYVIWPEAFLMPELSPDSRIVTIGYDAGMVKWSSPWPALTLEERAKVMFDGLKAAQIGNDANRSVFFVTHSMGGLLVKEILHLAKKECDPLVLNTAGVVFTAVPHFGANLSTLNNEALRSLLQAHPATKDLNKDNARLLQLNNLFQALEIPSLSLAEGAPAPLGLGVNHLIVKPESAHPRGAHATFHLLSNAHHMDICKPSTKTDLRYTLIRDFIISNMKLSENPP